MVAALLTDTASVQLCVVVVSLPTESGPRVSLKPLVVLLLSVVLWEVVAVRVASMVWVGL
jgi:hypothetical protein